MSSISVIVPVYNVEKYLSQCIDSLLNQTFKDIEIILVDDKSPDNCPKLCDDYAQKESRISVVHKEENQGLGMARNTGIEVAKGDYVAFCDSDDFLEPDTFETVITLFEQNKLDQIFYDSVWYNEGDVTPVSIDNSIDIIEGKTKIRHIALGIFDKPKGDKDIKGHYVGSSCMSLYKRSVLMNYGIRFYSEREYISEDYLFNFEYLQYTNRIGFIPSTFYHYRITPGSLSHKIQMDRVERAIPYCKCVESLIKKYGYDENDKQYAWGNFLRYFRSFSQMIMLSKIPMKEKRNWYFQQRKLDYHKVAVHCYDTSRFSFIHYIFFLTHKYKVFILHYTLICLMNIVKKKS